MRRYGNALGSMLPLIGKASAKGPPGRCFHSAANRRIALGVNILTRPSIPFDTPRAAWARLAPRSRKGGRVDEDRRREDDWFRQNERQLLEAARVAREKRERERAALE